MSDREPRRLGEPPALPKPYLRVCVPDRDQYRIVAGEGGPIVATFTGRPYDLTLRQLKQEQEAVYHHRNLNRPPSDPPPALTKEVIADVERRVFGWQPAAQQPPTTSTGKTLPRWTPAKSPHGPPWKFVVYYRVSTQRQGASGLGLAAQNQRVMAYLQQVGGHLVAEFTETESGRNPDRPQLENALAAARLHGAALLVATLDRLTRNVAFLHRLLDESGVKVVFADLPNGGDSRMLIGVLALVAEYEAEKISERTKAALAAAKARGVRLGNPRYLQPGWRNGASAAGVKSRKEAFDQRVKDVMKALTQIAASLGVSERGTPYALDEYRKLYPLRRMAAHLTAYGIPTSRGAKAWSAQGVKRILDAFDKGV